MRFVRAALARPWRSLAVLLPVAMLLALPALRVRFGGSVADLLPDRPLARSLARALEVVAGDDVDVVLVVGESPEGAARATDALARSLRTHRTVADVTERIAGFADSDTRALRDALLSRADDATLAALAHRLTSAGSAAAADRIVALALAPGGGAARDALVRDPFDLAALLARRMRRVAAGVRPASDGTFVSDDGLARIVTVRARGSAFDLAFCERLAADIRASVATVASAAPRARVEWTGPHAVALGTRDLLRGDLRRSSTLAGVLVTVIFLLALRRARAFVAVAIPLAIGAAWTTALAAVAWRGLNAITVAFAAIVLGVGMDTGVHLYARILDERAAGRSPDDAAATAVASVGRTLCVAALAAACAFASLALSELRALRQLGVLAAIGEVATALAILALTPLFGAAFERGRPPSRTLADGPWARAVGRVAASPAMTWLIVALVAGCATVFARGSRPHLAEHVVLARPGSLDALRVQREIFRRFGGESGQWFVVGESVGAGAAREASERTERALEALEAQGLVAGFETAAPVAPSARREMRNLEIASRWAWSDAAQRMREALASRGLRLEPFADAIDRWQAPLAAPRANDLERRTSGAQRRFIVVHPDGSAVWVAYVRPTHARSSEAVRAAIETQLRRERVVAAVTGYPLIESDVRRALLADAARVGGAALALVTVLLALTVRRLRTVVLAVIALAFESLVLLAFVALARIDLDAYNLLALPVLFGITLDEIVFVLHALDESRGEPRERVRRAVASVASATTATAGATAAGFLALLSCQFEALRGLGAVAGVGTVVGGFVALVFVPVIWARWPEARATERA